MEKTFVKGLMLLETLVAMEEPASVTRLGNMLGLYKSNVHRLLRTLVESGYVMQVDDGRYMPTLRLAEMGETVWRAGDLGRMAGPALDGIAQGVGCPALLLTAEPGRLRVRAASPSAPLAPGAVLPMAKPARLMADLAGNEGRARAHLLPLAASGPGCLCLTPLPDLCLPGPLVLGLVAGDKAGAAALAAGIGRSAEQLAGMLTGAGAALAHQAAVTA